jgi:hypothetical protein
MASKGCGKGKITKRSSIMMMMKKKKSASILFY